MQKKGLYLSSAFIGLALIIISFTGNGFFILNKEQLAKKAQTNFELKYKTCLSIIEEISTKNENEAIEKSLEVFEKQQIGIYIYKNDTLILWNNARWLLPDSLYNLKESFGLIKQKGGCYFFARKNEGLKTIIALCLVKPLFEIQNNYLKNDFAKWTGLPKSVDINPVKTNDYHVEVNHKTLFSIKSNEEFFYDVFADNFCLLLFYIGFILLLVAALLFIDNSKNRTLSYFILAGVILARFALLVFKCPDFFYRSSLYDLRIFGHAQAFVNGYLGDIFLNAVLILFVTIGVSFIQQKDETKKMNRVNTIVQVLLLALVFFQFNFNLKSLVSNSTLSFDFINIFSSNWLIIIILIAYAAYALALFVSLISLLGIIRPIRNNFLILILIASVICSFYFFIFQTTDFFETTWLIYFSVLIYFAYHYSQQNLTLTLGIQVLLISITFSLLLQSNIKKNQALELELLSQNLSEKKDAILESEYSVLPDKITKDGNFLNLINLLPSTEREVIQILKQNYFSGYFDRYNIDFSLFDDNCNPLIPVKNQVLVNKGYFEDKILQSEDSLTKGLYFLTNKNKFVQYIAWIPLGKKNLYILLEPKQFEETGSFPDLLIDQSLQKQNKLSDFSYAVYQSGLLSNRTGEFSYPLFLQDSLMLTSANLQYEHFYFTPFEGTKVIISQTAKTWKYLFTFNSYVLLFFSALVYLGYILYAYLFTSAFVNSSLTRRIQAIIILLLLFSMSTVGVISNNLVAKQFETKNQKQLTEKTQIIISELTGQFKLNQLFDEMQYDLLNLKLKEYARLFNTPISVFYGNGRLFNTSENKLYDLGLASKLANPLAYSQLRQAKTSSFCVNEKAGSLDYMSMYTALFDTNKNLIGLINLPYFAKQNDLSNELSGIISGLINVYVILFVLSILAGLILSGYITQPLRLIQQQIAKITLGKKNEKIIWNSRDEIGKLVFEYNQMLLKLEDSANQLARSERESAWREMAKQVAHEIKNPLTPMKLNLQYLQHLMKSNPDDFSEKFEKASAGIIEQIDSLANIATEFSNFAKLPVTQLKDINLAEIIAASTSLFENQKVQINTSKISQKEIVVKGDRDQCLRVFNNVLKNALQAVEEVDHPQIDIRIEMQDEKVIVIIEDNGCGMDDSRKLKIFTPNFTTKSTGSGLGLAMVKNSMLGFGGNVYFESELNKGTVFYLEFTIV